MKKDKKRRVEETSAGLMERLMAGADEAPG